MTHYLFNNTGYDQEGSKLLNPPTRMERISLLLVFGGIFCMYWWERSPGPGWGDSIGFIVSALEGFSWTIGAPEHFLYDNQNALLVMLFKRFDPIVLLTMVSIAYGLLTLIQIYRTGVYATGNRYAALLGMTALALSFTFWRQVEQVEVYTTATFLTASVLYCIFTDTVHDTTHYVVACGAWMGLALLVHIQTILLIPLYVAYLYDAYHKQPRNTLISLSLACSALLFLIVTAMIVQTYMIRNIFWGTGFHDEVFHLDISNIFTGFAKSIAYVCYSFHIHLVSMVIGFVVLHRYNKKLFVYCILGMTPTWLFAMRYPVSDQYVFFLNAYLILSVLSAYGYAEMSGFVSRRIYRLAILVCTITVPYLLYESAVLTAHRLPQLQSLNERKAYKGGICYFMRPGLRRLPDLLELAQHQDLAEEVIPPSDRELWQRLQTYSERYFILRNNME